MIQVGDQSWPVRLVPHARSRRYRLVFDNVRGELRLTMPLRGNARKAMKWAAEQQLWIAEQTAKSALPILIASGQKFPLEGALVTLLWRADLPRSPQLDGDALYLGGPEESVSRRTERWLKARALDVLEYESRIMAVRADLPLARVGVGDPRSRWGSCTAAGDIRYSWRLMMAPAHVRRATVAHEIAHLRHMDHGPAFHDFVDELHDGDVSEARSWLRRHGRDLHRYRFSD